MKMELYFDEEDMYGGVYDFLFEFFLEEKNVKALLSEETYYDTINELVNHISDIIAETLSNKIDVFHACYKE